MFSCHPYIGTHYHSSLILLVQGWICICLNDYKSWICICLIAMYYFCYLLFFQGGGQCPANNKIGGGCPPCSSPWEDRVERWGHVLIDMLPASIAVSNSPRWLSPGPCLEACVNCHWCLSTGTSCPHLGSTRYAPNLPSVWKPRLAATSRNGV